MKWPRSVPGVDDIELLQPRRLYERTGRGDEYRSVVERLKSERREYLEKYTALAPDVIDGIRV
jgi:phosphoenolpyruvate carboxykinase (ATP)